ncbi:Nucleolar protein 58 [Agyrium rufum]|nr:Nucleolar protein 58 [Agyrium rufum]
MGLFILTETSAGYALLKASDKKLLERKDLASDIDSVEQICSLLKLKNFQKFDSSATALEEVGAIVEGKVTSRLSSLLDELKDEKKASLAVADPKLGNAINKLALNIKPISDAATADLYRSIRTHISSLIPGLQPSDISTMSLGLSHSLSRFKLKFSPDKVDTMIVQAIALLDDLDKELNMYAMRVKEWYGWHFPEMGKIVNDNLAYAKVVMSMGLRTSAAKCDLSDILPEEIEAAVKAAAEISMGTEITGEDLENIQALAEQVVSFTEYRKQLSEYLSNRMSAIAPNLTTLVGDLVGARLIAHAGSLMNLAKSPASTIQILGAEKALFRALKTKHDTPKYGLIYHASLIGQATGKNKGKIARVLAAKAAIGIRVDALSDWNVEGDESKITEEEKAALGIDARQRIERRLAALEGRPLRAKGQAMIAPNGVSTQPAKWEVKEARKYNLDADGLAGDEPAAKAVAALLSDEKPLKSKKAKIEVLEDLKNGDVSMSDAKSDSEDDDSEEEEDAKKVYPVPKAKIVAVPDKGVGSDESEDDDEDESIADAPSAIPVKATRTTTSTHLDDKSDTITTVSNDSPESSASPPPQDRNWQSSITGNTKEAKKARKEERHQRKLALSGERSEERARKKAKLARRMERQERREKRAEQVERREDKTDDALLPLAKQAGLSLVRYKRKLERGEISFDANGVPSSISKKDIKRREKEAKKSEKKPKSSDKKEKKSHAEVTVNGDGEGKKRKREEEVDPVVEKSEKKKKKKTKA